MTAPAVAEATLERPLALPAPVVPEPSELRRIRARGRVRGRLALLLTRRADVMGALVNRRATTLLASVVAALIIALNAFLLFDTFFG